MHCEIDENVDLVGADLGDELVVGKSLDVVPKLGAGLGQVCGFVGLADAGIAVDFEVRPVVGFKQGEDEEDFGVPVEIGGNVADFEAAVEGAIVAVREDRAVAVAAIPFAEFAEDGCAVVVRVEIKFVTEAAVNLRVAGVEQDSACAKARPLRQFWPESLRTLE